MEYIQLGKTEFRVSKIGFGCEPLGGFDWGEVETKEIERTVSQACEQGINLFDTSDVYGLGLSEERLSSALGARRNDVVIVSKFGLRWHHQTGVPRAVIRRDTSPTWLRQALEGSLRRLRLDCIPIYLVHWPCPETPLDDTLEALMTCKRQGKINCFGVSNIQPSLMDGSSLIDEISVTEDPYSLINRSAEKQLFPHYRKKGFGVLGYGVLGQGLLTGKYSRTTKFPTTDRRHRLPHFQGGSWSLYATLLNVIETVAKRLGTAPGQVAIRWVLDQGGLDAAIVGIKNPEQLASGISVMDWKLPEDEFGMLDMASKEFIENADTVRPGSA